MKVDLDEALRCYVDGPVPLGMETRILARCRRRSWHWPVLGLVTACCLLAWATVRQPAVRPQLRYRPLDVTVTKVATAAQTSVKTHTHKSNGVNALWRFAQEHPEAAAKLAVEYEPVPIAPLQFEPISIEELEIDQQ